ncbi:MAG: hypothetical protein ACLQF1_09390 [Methyloceanibacter sp.]
MTLEPLVEALTYFGEAPTVWIITSVSPDPMNSGMGIQRSADLTSEGESFDHVLSLPHADAV